ncbi:hypothetical protein [Hymenobacter sublimis]|uniref:Uncharacterized protein n=1 Tax=Hymenobacter sublimis TaxID=2933777 RepID=A0ABY4JDA4_9BACT|nr:hypothetical protein [Hymenobacter sublimis]UPL50780.1 hypothetical protein MWH26_07720 [Hymenobacter sublimis]
MLTSTGRIWEADSTQKAIGWGSRTDEMRSGTGVAESPRGVWIHPPRYGEYAILELSPFPEIRLPFKPGQEWDWELSVGSYWSNPAWAVWQGQMQVKTHYKSVGQQRVATPLGKLECQQVTAVARCSAGQATLSLLFHPQYGFVELDYVNIDGGRLRFQLLSVGVVNEFDATTYFGKQ